MSISLINDEKALIDKYKEPARELFARDPSKPLNNHQLLPEKWLHFFPLRSNIELHTYMRYMIFPHRDRKLDHNLVDPEEERLLTSLEIQIGLRRIYEALHDHPHLAKEKEEVAPRHQGSMTAAKKSREREGGIGLGLPIFLLLERILDMNVEKGSMIHEIFDLVLKTNPEIFTKKVLDRGIRHPQTWPFINQLLQAQPILVASAISRAIGLMDDEFSEIEKARAKAEKEKAAGQWTEESAAELDAKTTKLHNSLRAYQNIVIAGLRIQPTLAATTRVIGTVLDKLVGSGNIANPVADDWKYYKSIFEHIMADGKSRGALTESRFRDFIGKLKLRYGSGYSPAYYDDMELVPGLEAAMGVASLAIKYDIHFPKSIYGPIWRAEHPDSWFIQLRIPGVPLQAPDRPVLGEAGQMKGSQPERRPA